MRKITICVLILIWAIMTKAHGMDAMVYFNLGLKSTMTGKKINYLSVTQYLRMCEAFKIV